MKTKDLIEKAKSFAAPFRIAHGGGFQLKDINPGTASSSPAGLINVGGTLFFTANDGTNGT